MCQTCEYPEHPRKQPCLVMSHHGSTQMSQVGFDIFNGSSCCSGSEDLNAARNSIKLNSIVKFPYKSRNQIISASASSRKLPPASASTLVAT